ncbi:MAG: Holliday junction ATP-dependent DNA helicase RuvA [Chlamydiae bacterium]|nr:Holliday junction ATP-dependent DNA helicase RuvA [Chlamydiota bacterium]
MYDFIRGKLIETTPTYVVLEAAGVGYKLLTPANLLGAREAPGKEILLYTSWVVRELSQTLYGFLERQERDLFEVLLSLSGIGPKIALAILGSLTLDDLYHAIQVDDFLLLSKVPGIGKKTAERLLLELRRKEGLFTATQKSQKPKGKVYDALQALLNLGYSQISAEKALKKAMETLPEESDLSILISAALQSR